LFYVNSYTAYELLIIPSLDGRGKGRIPPLPPGERGLNTISTFPKSSNNS